jgi:hypothetical protein
VTEARAKAPISGTAARSLAAFAGAHATVTVSSTAGEMRLSLRTVLIALTTATTGAISRSAAASLPLRSAFGKAATMMDSGDFVLPLLSRGSRCQISSEMKGMKGWSRRSVASSVVARVRWVTARATGSSLW